MYKRFSALLLALIVCLSSVVSTSAIAVDTVSPKPYKTYSLDQARVIADEIGYEQDSDGDGLSDVLELAYGSNPNNSDTDSDGVDDYTEFCVTHTDLFTPDGNIDTDNDGLTNAEELVYGTHPADSDIDDDGILDGEEIDTFKTDPLDSDTDCDGIPDKIEIEGGLNPLSAVSNGTTPDKNTLIAQEYFDSIEEVELRFEDELTIDPRSTSDDPDYDGRISSIDTAPNNNLFAGQLLTDYEADSYSSNVSYNMDYRWFFDSNTTYNAKLAKVSALASANIYADHHLNITSGGTLTTTDSNSMQLWMTFHGLSSLQNYTISNSDNHVSQMYIGHREVTYNGTTKNIVCVVIRGTNGTLKEWSSNFDLGSTATTHNEWTTSVNHKGFDITANRLNQQVNSYLSTYCYGETNVLWITGHSRGAALANVLAAKQIDAGKTVFAYTFASPNTTTSSSATATKYRCIFNLINTDDFVTYLPMNQWGFSRYGITKSASIDDSYEVDWQVLTGERDYNPDTIGLQATVAALAAVSSSRNNCYVYPTGVNGYIQRNTSTTAERDSIRSNIISSYTSNTAGTYKYSNVDSGFPDLPYGVRIFHQPAFLMQTLAGVMAKEMTDAEFALLDVAQYLQEAKWRTVQTALGGVAHPHYMESYYVLATKLT